MSKKQAEAIRKAYKEGRKVPFQPNPDKHCPDPNLLRRLYITKGRGSHFISKKLNVSQTLILKWLKQENISIRTHSQASKITLNGFRSEEKHVNWKGDEVGYQALHTWIRSRLGTPMKCERCGRTDKKKYEWCNVSKEYLRDLDDWIRLCTACHRAFDKA